MFRDPMGMKVVSFENGEPHLEQKNYTKRKEQVICSLRYPWFSARFLPGFTFDFIGGKCVRFDLETKETTAKLFSAESFGCFFVCEAVFRHEVLKRLASKAL